ncbi:MAG: hypothetical protein AB1555_08965 [Nitrospirota bacterium]
MKKPAAAVLVMLWLFLGGCAGPFYTDASFREALREQEAASARLIKALALYCSLTSLSLEARQQCIVEHRLLPFRAELDVSAQRSTSPAAAVPSVQLADRAGPSLVSCRRLRSQTTCRRADSLPVHSDGG